MEYIDLLKLIDAKIAYENETDIKLKSYFMGDFINLKKPLNNEILFLCDEISEDEVKIANSFGVKVIVVSNYIINNEVTLLCMNYKINLIVTNLSKCEVGNLLDKNFIKKFEE